MSADTISIYEALMSALGSDTASILQPGNDGYEKINGSYFSAFENELRPSFIAKPATAEQLQNLVRALRPHVLNGSCRIAVRGSGHTPFAGSANIQGGVTIDMGRIQGVKLSADKSLVEISAGEIWTNVYAKLDEHGLTTTGGRVGHIGVTGFLLGGGLSMFSSRRGFACDSVTEFKVVLASGELVTANARENPDLWIALKGGLNNFGIVTSITMKTFASGADIWGGLLYYPAESFSQLLGRACDYLLDETADQDVHLMCSAGYGYGHQVASCVMYHTRGEVDARALQPFLSVQPQIESMRSLKTATHSQFCEDLSKFSTDGIRQYWASITIKPDIDLINTMYEQWQETLTGIKDAEGFIFSFGFHPVTKALLENSRKAGGNAMDIAPLDGPLFVVLINPCWTLPQDDSRIFKAVGDLVVGFRELAAGRGLLHRYIFTNYAYHEDDVMAGYGEESLERMKGVSKKYDPEGVFQRGVPGGFKLV